MRSHPAPKYYRDAMGDTAPAKASERSFELNAQQKQAVRDIRRFLAGSGRFFGLYGYAGTGKTTTIHEALARFDGRVCMSAPTHKAVGVIASMAEEVDADYSTIHRLLGCRKQYKDGEIFFAPDPSRDQPIENYDLVVVDECSMVGVEMWGWIRQAVAASDGRLKVILMGDPLQLPPVKDGDVSPTFDLECARLDKIMRHQGVIESAATAMREAVDGGGDLPLPQDAEDEHGCIKVLGQGDFLEAILADLDAGKVLAYTNSAVDWVNDYIREHLFGPDAKPFEAGERLVLRETYDNGDRGMLYTEDEVRVQAASRAEHMGLPCWKLDVEDSEGGRHDLHTLDDGQRGEYYRALSKAKDRGKAGGGWKGYYELKEAFASVRPGWATTIHKSQGSTYEHVYVIQTNVLSACYDAAVRRMLLYVAYSRARRKLILS